ncbi:MAG: hypothetical protein K0U66_04170, partial [Gammaproteobacteria bacterium]|nr:hypothetical protein [Gammaproteobacteria bacterium]
MSFFVWTPTPTQACSCIAPGPPAVEFARATAVFVGRVTAITGAESAKGYPQRKVALQVEESWKGVEEESLTLYTGSGGGDCGYPFEEGESYLVYAYRADQTDDLGASICSRTQLLTSASEDLTYLRGPHAANAADEQVEVIPMKPQNSQIVSGVNIGFRIEDADKTQAMGQLLIKVGGEWLEAQFIDQSVLRQSSPITTVIPPSPPATSTLASPTPPAPASSEPEPSSEVGSPESKDSGPALAISKGDEAQLRAFLQRHLGDRYRGRFEYSMAVLLGNLPDDLPFDSAILADFEVIGSWIQSGENNHSQIYLTEQQDADTVLQTLSTQLRAEGFVVPGNMHRGG